MKALSVKQPWAKLICLGIKPIENRTWATKERGRVQIHASGKPVPFNGMDNGVNFTMPQRKEIFKLHPVKDGRYPDIMSRYTNSAIIGEVDIIDCVLGHESIWAEHRANVIRKIGGVLQEIEVPVYNWVLANPILYDQPILNVKGALSFWEYRLCWTTYTMAIRPQTKHTESSPVRPFVMLQASVYGAKIRICL